MDAKRMTTNQLDTDIADWSSVFEAELETHLQELRSDEACGFAIELPSDFGNDGIISRVAKTPTAIPSLDDWEYIPNGKTFDRTCDKLMELYAKHDEQFDDESFFNDFGNRLYAKILAIMQRVVSSGEFPSITVWLLTLSDDEHPILAEAARSLNEPSQQTVANSLLA